MYIDEVLHEEKYAYTGNHVESDLLGRQVEQRQRDEQRQSWKRANVPLETAVVTRVTSFE